MPDVDLFYEPRVAGLSYSHAGISLSSAGDINGDGFEDFIFGAQNNNIGAAYVVFGQAGGLPDLYVNNLAAEGHGFAISSEGGTGRLGFSVAGGGDINGDGYDDLIVGEPFDSDAGATAGAATVIFGHAGAFANIALATPTPGASFEIDGPPTLAGVGYATAFGDVNGDGFDDILLGAPAYDGAGGIYVVFGKDGAYPATLSLSSLSPSQGFLISGESYGDSAGFSVAAGDFNGDGYDDMLIGAAYSDDGGSTSGEAYIVFGKANISGRSLSTLTASEGISIVGDASDDNAGFSVAFAGDINGDGYEDIVIGAPDSNSGGYDSGAAYVIFGGTATPGTIDLTNLTASVGFRIQGDAENDGAGQSVRAAGDVNGDGFDDLIVGAPLNDRGLSNAGAAYLIFGKAGGFTNIDLTNLSPSDGYTLIGDSFDLAGTSVAGADIDGDGFSDLLVGAPNSGFYGNAGGVFVVASAQPLHSVTRIGTVASQTLAGGHGDDSLDGRDGDDRLYGHDGNDQLIGGAGNDTLWGGGDDDSLAGGSGNDSLDGGDGDDLLTGDAGQDTIKGGAGDDVVTAGSGDDIIDGGDDDDRINGGSGGDSITGGDGDDTLFGDSGNDSLIGGAGFDRLDGGSGADILDGGAGGDVMHGGSGDDQYYVNSTGDRVTEDEDQGTDSVLSAITYSIAGQYIENLILTGSAAINGTGNGIDNSIVGNSGVNVLNGGAGNDTLNGGIGNDTMIGGTGDDRFTVDSSSDIVTEADGQGTDTVYATATFSLAGQYVENLVLQGSANIGGTGNGLNNAITGNTGANALSGGAGNDILDGSAGADTMTGGLGDDIFYVDNAGDKALEANGEGTDTIVSSVTFAIGGQYVEILTLTGSANINGTGTSQANTLNGNSGANILNGGGGDDQLHGGLGNDTLIGGTGLDTYWFETALGAGNVDTISDFSVADDTIYLDRTIFAAITADGALAAAAYSAGTAAHDADDRIIYDQATGKIWYDADGNGAGAAVQFATVTANTALTVADFFAVP